MKKEGYFDIFYKAKLFAVREEQRGRSRTANKNDKQK